METLSNKTQEVPAKTENIPSAPTSSIRKRIGYLILGATLLTPAIIFGPYAGCVITDYSNNHTNPDRKPLPFESIILNPAHVELLKQQAENQ